MLERFLKWFYGYLYVRIKGNSPERFINLCNARNIEIWNIKKTEIGYEFNTSIDDFKRLPYVARKTKTRPYIRKRVGFPFYVKKIKPRKGLWAGAALFFMLLYLLSSFIWDIQFSGQHIYTEEALLKYLGTIDVYSGMRRDKLSCPDIETAIRETYKDIGWVSAELKGSRLFIKIQETNMPSLYESGSTPMHLTASRSGVIESIITRTGTPVVKAGDMVEKGDILISGVIDIYGDNGILVKKEAVLADGDVFIRAETSYYDETAKKYQKKEYTGTERISYTACFLQYKLKQPYPIGRSFWQPIGEHDILTENMEFYLNNTLKLPVRIIKNTYREYSIIEAEYSKEEMEMLLQKNFDYYIEKLMEKGVLINENNVKIVITESLGTMSGKFTILEKSDKFQKVEDDEWRIIETDEYSGNNN